MHRLRFRYGDIAPGIVPTVGAEVLARCSVVSPFTRARVRNVRRTRDRDRVRVDLVWLESNDATLTPVVAGKRGSVYARADGWPPLIRPAP
ncbi:hypothetical protein [Streptomyces albicerus]|uniref:hypothetical protein n=1 Tax=Streptomyces albicerus TaxID=2569859 RepID=UPI00124B74BF|nr:hypothetical protein [Streptomyces albicerus]